jgi:hypothetical protein
MNRRKAGFTDGLRRGRITARFAAARSGLGAHASPHNSACGRDP